MADNLVELHLRVNTETGAIDQLSQKLNEAAGQADKTGQSFKGAGEGASQLLRELGLIATAAGVLEFFKSSVTEAEHENEALRRLGNALEMNGISWKQNADQVEAWGSSIQQTTRFSDTEAFEALEKLTRVTGDLSQAQQASQVAMGLSVASGKELGETTQLITMLLNGNERAIKQVRNEYGSFVGNARTTQEVLDSLNKQFAHTAQQEESFTKTTAQLHSAFSDFQETIGRAFIPALSSVIKFITGAIQHIEGMGVVLASNAAIVIEACQGIAKAVNAAFKFDVAGVQSAFREMTTQITAIGNETVEELSAMEHKKTAAVAANMETQVRLHSRKSETVIKAEEEQANKIRDIENHLQQEILSSKQQSSITEKQMADLEMRQEIQKINQEVQNHKDKERLIAQAKEANRLKIAGIDRKSAQESEKIEHELAQKIEAIGKQTLQKKVARLNTEIAQERIKIQTTIKDHAAMTDALIKLDLYKAEAEAELTRQDLAMKATTAMDIVDLGVQTLSILNSMGNKHGQAEANRAKMILGLEKAIAIARAIAAAQAAGPFAGALAAAQIGLITAQFAQQYQAIDQAASQNNNDSNSFVFSQTNIGGNDSLITTTGNPIKARAGGVAGSSGGGPLILSSDSFSPSGSSGGFSGSNISPTINVGGISITVHVADLSPTERQRLFTQLADEMRSKTMPAIRFAVQSLGLAQANEGLNP